MASYIEVQKMFRELQPDVADRVRKLLPDFENVLDIAERDDGTYWFQLGDRRVRMELTTGKQLVIWVFEGEEPAAIRQLLGVLGAPAGISEMIAMALTRRI